MLLYVISLFLLPILVQGETNLSPTPEELTKFQSKDGLPLFLNLLRQHQRDADQTLQSFTDVLKRDSDWLLRNETGAPLINEKCKEAVNVERRKFGIFISDHLNDFEKCIDGLVEGFKADIFNANMDEISTETAKCISLTRMNVFWKEYKTLIENAKQNCQ